MSLETDSGLSCKILSADECLARCGELAGFISPAFARAAGEVDEWSALRDCAFGRAVAFEGDHNGELSVLLIAQLIDFPLKRVCNVLAYAGEARRFYHVQGLVEEWARINGAVEMRGYGGEAQCRLARRHGYREIYRMYAKPL
jgi:hypothetical protein